MNVKRPPSSVRRLVSKTIKLTSELSVNTGIRFAGRNAASKLLACIARVAVMQTIATDDVAWSVCPLVATVNPAKAAEPIEMQLGSDLGPQVLDGARISQL